MDDDSNSEAPFIIRLILEPILPQEWSEDKIRDLLNLYLDKLQIETDLYHESIEIKNIIVRGKNPITRLKAVIILEYHSIDILKTKNYIYNQLPSVIHHTLDFFNIDNLPMEIIIDKTPRTLPEIK